MAVTKARSNAVAKAAKGDLSVGSGTNASSILAVGTDAQILVADSTASTGLKWATASSGTTVKLTSVTPASDFTSSSSSLIDVTGYEITITPTSATNKIQIFLNFSYKCASASSPDFVLYDGATVIRYVTLSDAPANKETANSMMCTLTNVSATSHTFKLKQKNASGVSTTVIGANSGTYSTLNVLEVY